MQDYCNGAESFINYTLSNPKNISGGGIRCSYKRCKNKKFLDLDVVTIQLLQKSFMEKYLWLFAYEKSYVPYEIMVERMTDLTSSSRNIHGVVVDYSNLYRSMMMDAMRMNQVMQVNVQM